MFISAFKLLCIGMCVQVGQTNHAFHITYNVKVNFPSACHKDTEGSGGIAPFTLNPIMAVSDELHALNALPQATLQLESGWSPQQVGMLWRR